MNFYTWTHQLADQQKLTFISCVDTGRCLDPTSDDQWEKNPETNNKMSGNISHEKFVKNTFASIQTSIVNKFG